MRETFLLDLNEIFNVLKEPIDSIYKNIAINNYKKRLFMDNNDTFGQFYCKFLKDSKSNGTVYTPEAITMYIIKNTLSDKDIISNPFIKIADPSCGAGNFLIALYKYLFSIYNDNMDIINKKHKLSLNKENISRHIIDNNIFGFDIDEHSIKCFFADLFSISEYINVSNIKKCDFLLENIEEKFDIIIGNPPYVGHKSVDKEYALKLKKLYSNIYIDKGDISYCFFEASTRCLEADGKLTFITSRYFLESPSGEELRKFLINFCSINKIVDFYGIRPFKGAGIDPVIIFISKSAKEDYDIEVIKPKGQIKDGGKVFINNVISNLNEEDNRFYINKKLLNHKGWILKDEISRNIIDKIERKCFVNLFNICESYQGIITGCDNAFVVSIEDIHKNKIEKNLIKPWIKSSYIEKFNVNVKDKYLIYSNLIDSEDKYPCSIRYIENCKDKLINRRECIKGIRKWYELQWGRNNEIFEDEKIIFPYKSNDNRFALDEGNYFSADVYCLKLKDNSPYTYEFLLRILNSNLYEFYYKSFAKKLGENLYEYYPNNVMKLCIPNMDNNNFYDEESIYSFFEINKDEKEIIEKELL